MMPAPAPPCDHGECIDLGGTSFSCVCQPGWFGTLCDSNTLPPPPPSTATRAYVANLFSDSLSVIDVATNTVAGTIPVAGGPQMLIISPDNSALT